MRARKMLSVLALAVLFPIPAQSGVTEVFGVYRHLSKADLLKDLADRGVKRYDTADSGGLEAGVRSMFVLLTKQLLQSTDPTLKISPETWPVDVLVFDRAPDGTRGIVLLLIGYCGDRQVFVLPVFDQVTFTWSDIVGSLDSKYTRVSLDERQGIWNQTSSLSLGKPIRTIMAVRIKDRPHVSALVLYLDALNTMNVQADLFKKEKERRRGF